MFYCVVDLAGVIYNGPLETWAAFVLGPGTVIGQGATQEEALQRAQEQRWRLELKPPARHAAVLQGYRRHDAADYHV